MNTCRETLEQMLNQAVNEPADRVALDTDMLQRVEFVCRCPTNRAAVRFLMACLLAKIQQPEVDPRKPYTEIGDSDSFSGRRYDENCITPFINQHNLPCNRTTAFLTPAFRNINRPLTTQVEIVGRPRKVYADALQLLDDVQRGRVTAESLLTEVLRVLVIMKNEQAARMQTLLAGLRQHDGELALSAEGTVKLIEQHLAQKNSSRLPVLIVVAAYRAARAHLGEQVRPLQAHNAADEQTGALGDIEITMQDDDRIVTCYEMKMRRVTIEDIDVALAKLAAVSERMENYIFITTDMVPEEVKAYAESIYEKSGGVEVAILDCIGFLRHFLHLFHRLRVDFLNHYQDLVLTEPDSALNPSLKEAFLLLRQTAERLLVLKVAEPD